MECEIALTAWTNNPARLKYFEDGMEALRANLTAVRHSMTRILVCSEELTPEYKVPFEALCVHFGVDLHYHPAPAEIGQNHNLVLSLCEADYVLFTEDDNHLSCPFDLSSDIDFLESRKDFVIVRYVLGHSTTGEEVNEGLVEVRQDSPYLYSNQTHLRHRRRFEQLGPFTEGADWGGQELGMSPSIIKSPFRVAGRKPPVFAHIGHFASEESRWPEGKSP